MIKLDKSIQSPNHPPVLGAYRPPIGNHTIINDDSDTFSHLFAVIRPCLCITHSQFVYLV